MESWLSARMHGSTGRSGYPSDSSRCRWSRGGSSLSGRYLSTTTHPPPSSLRVRGGGAAPLGPVTRLARGPQVPLSSGPRDRSRFASRRARALPLPPAPGAIVPRLPRRAGVRPLQSAPGASVPRLTRRTGVRPLSSASGAGVPRLPRWAGVRSLSTGVWGQSPTPPRRAGVRPHLPSLSHNPASARGPSPTADDGIRGPDTASPELGHIRRRKAAASASSSRAEPDR